MSTIVKKNVRAHITRAQKIHLQSLMAEQPGLRSGKFTASFTTKDAAHAWQDIARRLNAIPGAEKDWKTWRKTWQDIYSKTKAKQAEINRGRRQTGGGPAPNPLNEFEESVASLINPRVVSGHEESVESEVIYNFDYHPQDDADVTTQDDEVIVYNILEDEPSINPANYLANQQANKKQKINIKTLLKEKVEIKKQYYEEKLKLMKEQNETLKNLNESIKMLGNSLNR